MRATKQLPATVKGRSNVRPQIRDAERTKAAVLAAATREFAEHGMGGARIELIAKRARVNKQLIYYYFGSKEALYIAVLEGAYARLRTSEAALDVDALDPIEGITELALFNWRYHCQHPELISLVRTENLHKAKYLKRSEGVRSLNSPLIATLEISLGESCRAGHLPQGCRRGPDLYDDRGTELLLSFKPVDPTGPLRSGTPGAESARRLGSAYR